MELWQLQQLQGLPIEIKIRKTEERIKEWYNFYEGSVYVSFSGGKDSTVLLSIARNLYPDIEAVFVDTGLEYPEIRDFVKTFDNVTWLKPKMNFKEVLDKYGYPVVSKEQSKFIYELKHTKSEKLRNIRLNGNASGAGKLSKKWVYLLDAPFKISDQCCSVMKKGPVHKYGKKNGMYPLIATMTDESFLRKSKWMREGCNAFDNKNPTSTPMAFWTEQDILHYILDNEIKYCSVYGDIISADQVIGQTSISGTYENLKMSKCQRTGCMFCMYGCHLEKEPNRFQMMKKTHPKQYDYCINKLGLGDVLNYINVKY